VYEVQQATDWSFRFNTQVGRSAWKKKKTAKNKDCMWNLEGGWLGVEGGGCGCLFRLRNVCLSYPKESSGSKQKSDSKPVTLGE